MEAAPRAAGGPRSRAWAGWGGDGDASDATPEIAAAIAGGFDPWPGATAVETAGSPRESLHAALRAVGAADARA